MSSGAPGQRMKVKESTGAGRRRQSVLEVSDGEGWEEWTEVEGFCRQPLHWTSISCSTGRQGEVVFGPAVRRQDGRSAVRRRAGKGGDGAAAVLPYGRWQPGQRGPRRHQHFPVLHPYVSSVENRRAASGGVDGETVEEAKVRGPLQMRTRNRAVTAHDYEQLTREAAPQVASVRCVPAGGGDEARLGHGADGVRVLVIPAVAGDENGRLRFEQLILDEQLLRTSGQLPRRTTSSRGSCHRGAASLPGHHCRCPASGPPAGSDNDRRGSGTAGALPIFRPHRRRSGPGRLALRPASQRGRGVRRPSTGRRRGVRRGRPALRH